MDDCTKIGLFDSLYDNSPVGLIITGPDLETIVGFSRGAENIFGISAEKMIGKKADLLYADPSERKGILEKLLKEGRMTHETSLRKRNAKSRAEEIIHVHFSLALRYGGNKKPVGTVGIVEDRTEKKLLAEKTKHLAEEAENFAHGMVYLLLETIHNFDSATADHSQRVSIFSERIGRLLGMKEDAVAELGLAVLLHDIGKTETEEEALLNGRSYVRTDKEMDHIRQHCSKGAAKLKLCNLPETFIEVEQYHHERWDGNGYYKLKGQEIPLWARIVSIADAYDSMTEGRPYRLSMDKETAIEELRRCSGMEFDGEKILAYNKRSLRHALINDVKTLNFFRIPKRIIEHTRLYLNDRMKKEMQFDPEISEIFIKYLETTKNPLS